MQMTIACVHCGKLLHAPRELSGKPVRCVNCLKEFILPYGSAKDSASTPAPTPLLSPPESPSPLPMDRPSPTGVSQVRDDTLSRSMLVPMSRLEFEPAEEMRCRLEPDTLRWMNVSESLRDFLGMSDEQLRSQSFLTSLYPDDRELARDEFRQAVERGERHDFILRMRGARGSWRYMRFFTQARYDPDGRLNHLRCALKDVTDRIREQQELKRRTEQLTAAYERLRQVNHELKETQGQLVHSEKLAALVTLSAGMAHEINNPLAIAMNNVAILDREMSSLLEIVACYQEGLDDLRAARPELADRIEQLQEEADLPYLQENLPGMVQASRKGLRRVAQIVQNLRGFAQLDRAQIGDVDINESIDLSLEMLDELLSREQIRVERDYGTLPPLEAAGAHLNQVFLNLLINAKQAIEGRGQPSGTIRVTTRLVDGEIVVEVADDGCGIPADVLPKVFDPFFTTKPVGHGTGLGLSISHGIVAEHGGRIEVESCPGQGTRFRVRLPLNRTPTLVAVGPQADASDLPVP